VEARGDRLRAPRDTNGRAAHRHFRVSIGSEVERRPRRARQHLAGLRPLQRQNRVGVVGGFELRLLRDQELVDGLKEFLRRTRRKLQKNAVGQRVGDEQRDHLADGVEKGGRAPLPRLKRLHVVGEHALEERRAIATRHGGLAEHGAIDHSGARHDGPVLSGHVAVIGGHEPAGEFPKSGAFGAVEVVQRQ
jgi:hypothetical protein